MGTCIFWTRSPIKSLIVCISCLLFFSKGMLYLNVSFSQFRSWLRQKRKEQKKDIYSFLCAELYVTLGHVKHIWIFLWPQFDLWARGFLKQWITVLNKELLVSNLPGVLSVRWTAFRKSLIGNYRKQPTDCKRCTTKWKLTSASDKKEKKNDTGITQ